jgi:hypothetical protein
MIRLLRRSRLLAVVLLLATPALGGAWLQAFHPCPVDTPWLEHHGHGHEHDGASKAQSCHCVSSCSAASIAVLPTAAAKVEPTPQGFSPRPLFSRRADAPLPQPSELLPPATAPPLS